MNNQLQNKIMNRVYGIWFFRKIRYSYKVRALIFAGAMVLSQFWVSFPEVIRNINGLPKTPSNLFSYLVDASLKTELQVQIMFFVAVLMIVFFVIDGLKRLGRPLGLN